MWLAKTSFFQTIAVPHKYCSRFHFSSMTMTMLCPRLRYLMLVWNMMRRRSLQTTPPLSRFHSGKLLAPRKSPFQNAMMAHGTLPMCLFLWKVRCPIHCCADLLVSLPDISRSGVSRPLVLWTWRAPQLMLLRVWTLSIPSTKCGRYFYT